MFFAQMIWQRTSNPADSKRVLEFPLAGGGVADVQGRAGLHHGAVAGERAAEEPVELLRLHPVTLDR